MIYCHVFVSDCKALWSTAVSMWSINKSDLFHLTYLDPKMSLFCYEVLCSPFRIIVSLSHGMIFKVSFTDEDNGKFAVLAHSVA